LRCSHKSLQNCASSEQLPIFVFSDETKCPDLQATLDTAHEMTSLMLSECATHQFVDSKNGTARFISDGGEVWTEKHCKAIVIEDECLLAPQYQSFMNSALIQFERDEMVFS
jgi:hypothetical protein